MSNDLISREALKEATKSFIDCDGFNPVWQIIDNAPTVSKKELQKIFYETAEKPELKEVLAYECGKAAARPRGEWIPIKTRKLTEEEREKYPNSTFMYDCQLPDDGEDVLVTTWGGNVALDTFCRDDGCYFEYGCDEGDVIAWQPLPKPYEKGGAE